MRAKPLILCVDDEPANRALLKKLLSRYEYDLTEAWDGPGALAACVEQQPDLVLLDVMMPGFDGLEVCRRVRTHPELASVPILLLTALNRPDERAAGLESGANDFLTKPFQEIELIARVRALLRTKLLADTLRDVLGRYVSDVVATKILSDPAAVTLGGDRRTLTTVFVDLRGYSALLQEHPPELVIAVLNRYISLVADLIQSREGVVDDLLGDGILAFFGAPIAHDDDPKRAVEAALAIQAEIGRVQVPGLPDLRLQSGIGITTGEGIVGNIGSERRMKYTAIGDSVNVAARLQTAAGPGQVLVDEATHKAVEKFVISQDVGTLRLAGHTEWVRAFNVVALNPEKGR